MPFATTLRACLLLAGAAALALPAAVQDPAPGSAADRAAIEAHIASIFAAYQAKDRETVRATHAADWRGFLGGSRGVIRGRDQYMASVEPFFAGAERLTAWRMREFDCTFRDGVALVSYVADLDYADERGAFTHTLRVFDVYAREGGRWNQVASHVASHPESLERRMSAARELAPAEREQLLRDREALWRAWFGGERAELEVLLPAETLTFDPGGGPPVRRDEQLQGSAQFAAGGGRLLALEFPSTEIQAFGEVAVLYTTFRAELESAGQRQTMSGRATEIFVRRGGRWLNPGWHMETRP